MNLERRYIYKGYRTIDWRPVEPNTYNMVTYMVAALLALSSTKQVTIYRERCAIEYRRRG